MASGSLCLVLQEPISWEAFPEWAELWCRRLKATRIDEAEGIDERLWSVSVGGNLYWLVYDSWQAALTLEPQQAVPDETVRELTETLRNKCGE